MVVVFSIYLLAIIFRPFCTFHKHGLWLAEVSINLVSFFALLWTPFNPPKTNGKGSDRDRNSESHSTTSSCDGRKWVEKLVRKTVSLN